jgi:hypothetical protein
MLLNDMDEPERVRPRPIGNHHMLELGSIIDVSSLVPTKHSHVCLWP